jgi:tRNA-splicing ligase RtcB
MSDVLRLEKINDFRWHIPMDYKPGMRVPGVIYADERLLKDIRGDKALEQVANVAFLPGIVNASLAMPDIHWGYGFPVGGVAATDPARGGVISPAGVGFVFRDTLGCWFKRRYKGWFRGRRRDFG